MLRSLVRLLGLRLARRAFTKGGMRPALLDPGLGFSLLRDRRVPSGCKLVALGLGVVAMMALIALEVPVEAAVALMLSVAGLGLDVGVDGLELVVGALLVSSVLLVRLAPPAVVARVQGERRGAVRA